MQRPILSTHWASTRRGAICLGVGLLLFATPQPIAAQTKQNSRQNSQPADSIPRRLGAIQSRLTPELPQLSPVLLPVLPQPRTNRVVLKIKERRVYVYQGDHVKTSYPVAVGRPGWETPTGEFQVLEMVKQPGWTNPFTQEVLPPSAENPLGERWIAFWTDGTNYVGFHGTPSRDSIGQAASHGCVRMLNEDVRELYEAVQIGTPVIVEP
jgi:L,D-transpeptidase ErfK/SrfK